MKLQIFRLLCVTTLVQSCVLDIANLDGVTDEYCESEDSCETDEMCMPNANSWTPSEIGDLNPKGAQANAVLLTGLRLELRDTGEPGQLEVRVCKVQDSPPTNFIYSIHVTFKDELGIIDFDEVMVPNGTSCMDYVALDGEESYPKNQELKIPAWRVVSPNTSTLEWDFQCDPDSVNSGGTCWFDGDGPAILRNCD